MRRMGRPSPRPSLLQPGGGGTTTSDADSQAQAVTDDEVERGSATCCLPRLNGTRSGRCHLLVPPLRLHDG